MSSSAAQAESIGSGGAHCTSLSAVSERPAASAACATDAMNAAPASARAQASGVTQTVRQVGGSAGLAIMATVVTAVGADPGVGRPRDA